MNEDILKEVLLEISEEIKLLDVNNKLLTTAIENLQEKIDGFEERLAHLSINIPPVNTQPIEAAITNGLYKVRRIIENHPKNVIHEKRILLFPEVDKYELHRIANILKWSAIPIILIIVFSFFKSLFIQHEDKKYKTAWEYLYQRQNKKNQIFMDSTLTISKEN